MSETNSRVDEKILQFTFHNEQFESGVKQSISSLLHLKHTVTDTLGSINGHVFDGLSNAFKGFNTSGMEKNLGTISDRFSTMGIIGTTVLQNLTNKAVNLGVSLMHKVLSPINSIWGIVTNKGWARASGVKQAQFMISNLGLSWDDAYDIIDESVQGTRFGFDEAAQAAAQLATSGVKFGGDMRDVLLAIGNTASMANVEFSDMSHIFTTMASNGRVYGEQLQQMSYRGLNATKALADYLHTTEANVKELVSKGKVSFSDFYKAMNQMFGDAAHKADETFTGALANNKAVFARIGQVYASGFMDAALVVLQHTKPMLKKFEKAIKPFGELAGDVMGMVAHYLVPIIDSIKFDKITNFVDKYVTPLRDKVKGITNEVKGVKDEVQKTLLPAEELLEMANKVIRGDYGNGQKRREELEALGYSYEQIQNKVNDLLGCSFQYDIANEDTEEQAEKTSEQLAAEAKAAEHLGKVFEAIGNFKAFAGGIAKVKDLFGYMIGTVTNIFSERIFDALPTGLVSVSKFFAIVGKGVGSFIDWIVDLDFLGKAINGFLDIIDLGYGALTMFLKPFKEIIEKLSKKMIVVAVFKDIKNLAETVFNFITSIPRKVKDFISETSQLSGVSRMIEHFGGLVRWLEDRVVGAITFMLKAIHKLLNPKEAEDKKRGLFNLFGEDGFINKIANDTADFIDAIIAIHKRIKAFLKLTREKGAGVFDTFIEFTKKYAPKLSASMSGLSEKFNGLFGSPNLQSGADFFRRVFEKLVECVNKFKNLESVQRVIKGFSALGQTLKEGFLQNFEKLLQYIDKTFGTKLSEGDGLINVFGEGGVVDLAAGFLEKMIEGLERAPEAIEKFFKAFQNAPQLLSEKSDVARNVLDVFDTVFKEASKGLPNFFKFLTSNMTKFVGDATASMIKDGLSITPFGDTLNGAVDKVVSFVGWFFKADKAIKTAKSSLADASESTEGLKDLMEAWNKYSPTIVPIFKEIGKHVKSLKDWDSNDFLNFFKGAAVVKILQKTGDAIGNFGKIFRSISDVIGGDEGSIKSIFESFSGIGTNIGNAAKNFSDLAKNWSDVSGVFKQWRKKPFTTALRDFAIAVALIAASIALLGSDFVNYDRIRENADVLAAFAGFFIVFAGLMAMAPPDKINALAAAFAGMGIGLLALTAAIAIFGIMPPEVLIKGGIAVVTLMTFLALAAQIAASNRKQATWSFLAMAVAVDMLVPAVFALGLMKPEVIDQGGKAIVKFMLAMAVASQIAASNRKQAALSFLAMALAVNLLLPAVLLFGKMRLDTLIQGGVAVVTFMTLMAIAIRIAGQSSIGAAASFLAIAVAINLLVPALALLSMLKLNKLMGAVTAISIAMLAISGSIFLASKNGGSIKAAIAMAAATYLVGLALVELASLDTAKVLASAVSLGLVFVTLAATFKMMQKFDGKKLGGSVAALLAVVIGVGAVIFALAKFTNVGTVIGIAVSISALVLAITVALKLLNGIDPKAAVKVGLAIDIIAALVGGLIGVAAYFTYDIDDLAQRLNKFGLAINAFFSGLGGTDINERAAKTEEAGKSLTTFADSIGGFLEMLDDADETKAANAKNLADAIWALTKTEIVQAIASWLNMTPDFGTFGDSMKGYATAFFAFADTVEAHGSVNTDNMADILEATDDWIDLAEKLGPNVGLFANIAGFTDMSLFGQQMAKFGEAFVTFAQNIGGIEAVDIDKIKDIKEGTEPMIDIANKIEANSGWLPDFFGISDIGKFGLQLANFAVGFKNFYEKVDQLENIDVRKINDLAEAVTPMVSVANALDNSGGKLQKWIGAGDLSNFGSGLAGLGQKLVEFAGSVNDPNVNPQRIKDVTDSLSKLIGMGDATQTYFIDSFSTAFTNLGVALGNYAVNATNFSPDSLSQAVEAFKNLRDFFSSISGTEYTGVSDFVKSFTEIGKTSTQSFADSFTDATGSVTQSISSFFTSVANSVAENNASSFNLSGAGSAKSYGEGFKSQSDATVNEVSTQFVSPLLTLLEEQDKYFKAKGILASTEYGRGITSAAYGPQFAVATMVTLSLNGFGNVYARFYSKGQDAAHGFRDGIADEGWKAVDEARNLANQALDELARAQDSSSPSKEFAKLGTYAAQGYALGIEKDAKLSSIAAEELAKESLAKAMVVVSSLANMIDQNMNAAPVIRPVIDTSGVEYGMGRISDMFNQTEGYTSNMLYRASAFQNEQSAAQFDRNSTDYTDKFNDLIDSNGQLINAVRENRYAIIDGDSTFDYINRRMGSA